MGYLKFAISSHRILKSGHFIRFEVTTIPYMRNQPSNVPRNVLIAVSNSLQEPWLSFLNKGLAKTWLSDLEVNENQILHFFSNPPNKLMQTLNQFIERERWLRGKARSRLLAYTLMFLLKPIKNYVPAYELANKEVIEARGTQLRVKFPDTYASLRWRRLSVIDFYLKNTDFDYLIFVNPSTYLNLSALKDFLDKVKDFNYGGMIKNSADSPFVVGSFIVLSRRCAKDILEKRKALPTHVMDDVAIGSLLSEIGINPTTLNSLEVLTKEINLQNFDYTKCINYKIKVLQNQKRLDVFVLKAIHEQYKALQEGF